MEQGGDGKRFFSSEYRRDRIQLSAPVKFVVLQCIDDVEATDPADYGERKVNGQRTEMAGNRQVSPPPRIKWQSGVKRLVKL